MLVKKVMILNIQCDVHLLESGKFQIVNVKNDLDVYAETMSQALVDAERFLKKAKAHVAVPVVVNEEANHWGLVGKQGKPEPLQKVVVYGIHQGHGKILYRKADGSKRQGHSSSFYRDMTDEELQEMIDARKALEAAQKNFYALTESRKCNIRKLVEQASQVEEEIAEEEAEAE